MVENVKNNNGRDTGNNTDRTIRLGEFSTDSNIYGTEPIGTDSADSQGDDTDWESQPDGNKNYGKILERLDKLEEKYLAREHYPNRHSAFQETLKARRKREDKATRLSKIERQASKKPQLSGHGWNQLLTKVQGDIPTAERLIKHLKIKYPGQSNRWYIEKAIFDLERDKGRY